MGIGAQLLKFGLPAAFLVPEVGKVQNASKEGKTFQQILGSSVNFGKWMAIPAALALLNPATVAAATAVGVAGFILPNFIPDINVAENKENQGLSLVG